MINLVPQTADVNRCGLWRKVENDIGTRAKSLGTDLDRVVWEILIWYDENNRPKEFLIYFRIYNRQGLVEENTVQIKND